MARSGERWRLKGAVSSLGPEVRPGNLENALRHGRGIALSGGGPPDRAILRRDRLRWPLVHVEASVFFVQPHDEQAIKAFIQ